MILEALYQLAEQEELMSNPDFEFRPVAWLIRVDRGGKLLGIEDTRFFPDAVGKRKPKLQAKNLRIPRQGGRTSGDRAYFLCDKAEYALGVEPQPDPKKPRTKEKLARRFALFRDQLTACLGATADEGIRAASEFLENVALGQQTVALPIDCGPGDLFAFIFAPDIDRPVHERPAVRDYWKAMRQLPTGNSANATRCLITGEIAGEPGNFPLLKRVPGGTASGVAIVSFNKTAFESYGWRGNENARISRDAAEGIATALNRLLHPAYPDPRPEHLNETLPQRHFRISADTVVCFWSSSHTSEDFLDAFTALFEGDEAAQVGELYRSLWRGRAVKIDDPSRFYALTISGAQGRAIVRDWFESSVGDVARNLARHFADLAIVRNTPPPRGKELSRQVPLRALLASMAPLGNSRDIPTSLAAQCVDAALRGAPYPIAVLQKALERNRAEMGRTDWPDLERRDARAALIKGVLRRNTSHTELTPNMDPTNTQPGYVLGRLMAVLERLQQAALGQDVNATVVDRFFGAASATPQAVFPRLLKNARHHARKAKDKEKNDPKTRGTAVWLDCQIDAVLAPLGIAKPPRGQPYFGFPAYLQLDQQGLFMLGYHQQRHWLWLSKEDRERLDDKRTAVGTPA